MQTVTFYAVFERKTSNFLSIIEWEISMCNFDWSSLLCTANPRYVFDLHALYAETLLQLLHQASPFSMETDTLQLEYKQVWA